MKTDIGEAAALVETAIKRLAPTVERAVRLEGKTLPMSAGEVIALDLLTAAFRVAAADREVAESEAATILAVFRGAEAHIPEWMRGVSASTLATAINKQKRSKGSMFEPTNQRTSLVIGVLAARDRLDRTNDAQQYLAAMFQLGNLVARSHGPVTAAEKVVLLSYIPTKWMEMLRRSPTSNGGKTGAPTDTPTVQPAATTGEVEKVSVEAALGELESLVGLATVKAEVRDLASFVRVQQLRRERGLKETDLSLHMVFTGNPGTGKTTVARMLAKIFKALGVVSAGHLVETDRAGLVAGYVGQTAIRTEQVVASAKGGVLFIDEAYSLTRSQRQGGDYGAEALETLLKRMEDLRSDLVVIVAGYTNEMKEFMMSNPGLSSRFARTLRFDDYSESELLEIFRTYCRQQDYKLTRAAEEALATAIARAYALRDSHFGNARYVRNLFEETIGNLANRVITLPEVSRETLTTIEAMDVPESAPCS